MSELARRLEAGSGLKWPVDFAAATALLAFAVFVHLSVPGLVPSGSDGGNWLALAKESLGLDVMSAETSYPFLYIGFLSSLLRFLDPIVALTLSALVAQAALVLAVYVSARPVGRVSAFLVALAVGFAGAQGEAYAWGGYPQILATAFALLAVHNFIGSLQRESWGQLIMAGLLGSLTSATHLMVGGLLAPALFIAAIRFLYGKRARWRIWMRTLMRSFLAAAPVVLVFGFSWMLSAAEGIEPTLNPLQVDYAEGFMRLTRDAPVPWMILAVLAVAGLLWPYWPDPQARVVAAGSGWTFAGLIFFFASGEPRSLLLTQIGVVLISGVVLSSVFAAFREGSHAPRAQSWLQWARWGVLILVISVTAAIGAGGLVAYEEATNWYRIVDRTEVDALTMLKDASESGDIVLAAEGHHGNPGGWWVEGVAERPTYTGVEVGALAFPDEIEQAEIANRFFSTDLSREESMTILEETGADFVAVDRRGPDAQWLDTGFAELFTVVDDSSSIVVLRVPAD